MPTMIMLLWVAGSGLAEPVTRDILLQPFGGFSEAGMAPIYSLFQADAEGRTLLRRARRKLGGQTQLDQVLCYCSENQLAAHPERRGLFMQEAGRLYRLKGKQQWREETRGTLSRLAEPERHPVVATERLADASFEFMRVAFRPKVCVKRGLSNLESYLVLYHELTHLSGLAPFEDLDLRAIAAGDKRKLFYYAQLSKPGGELEAFLAQVGAFGRLKQRFAIEAYSPLEGFLTEQGRLLASNRPAFLEHLLDKANYRVELDAYLAEQVYFQYNRAHSWWTLYEDVLEQMADRMKQIEGNIASARKAVADAKSVGDRRAEDRYRKVLTRWQREQRGDRAKVDAFRRSRREHVELMTFLDKHFPE